MNGSIFRKAIAIGILSSTFGIASIALSTTSASASPVITAAPAALPKFGDTGPEVVRLQEAIMARGFSIKGGVTGSYSEATRSALKSLQKVAGFKASGTLDAKTAKFLGLVDVVALSSSSLPAVGSSGVMKPKPFSSERECSLSQKWNFMTTRSKKGRSLS